ncbi:MAG: PEP-CTERM sorting domain-containing protein [Phycisphaeraceae bacterium]|nr:PEP-CTERM sorting domain-containing protein [Phycisphaeraceae bacterium]
MNSRKMAFVAGAVCAALAGAANADVIANWTFETSLPDTAGPYAAEAGANAASSFASGFHATSTTYSNPVGNGSAESYSSNAWSLGDYYQFTTSTLGYTSITISFDQSSSNTGPRDYNLMWSTNGTTFTQLGSTYAVLANASPNPVWSSGTYQPAYTFGPIAATSALDNQATIYFRLVQASTVSANGGTVAATGTDRVDNVIISGTVPAPGAVALLGMGGLLAARRRRA